MWSTVDNSVSLRAGSAKLWRTSVDNDCGQMCTKSLFVHDFVRASPPICGPLFGQFFVPISTDSWRGGVTDVAPFACRIFVDNPGVSTIQCGKVVDSTGVAFGNVG